jgi:lysozyme family protein
MADFETAFNVTDQAEGRYDNDKDDRGGETYRGRARKFNPEWPGWIIIDSMKARKDFPECLDANEELQRLVKESYRQIEWNGIQGDKISNQAIANEVYDNAVNMGVKRSVEYLQRTINILNRNQRKDMYLDIKVDGSMGAKTIEALKVCIKKNTANMVLNVLNGFQVKHYLTLMERNPIDEKWIGWFKRVEIMWN